MATSVSSLIAEHSQAHGAAFPGSTEAQNRPWSQASELFNSRDGRRGLPQDRFESYFYVSVNHSDFDPAWPIAPDWPAVIRGLRGSLRLSQVEFAHLLQIGRATVERWESGKSVPYRGDGLQLLTLVRDHIATPLQAGQALNLAASVVLPHVTQPTAEYTGEYLANLLRRGKHDHADMGAALLNALAASRILVPIDPTGDELEDTYFPLAARLRPRGDLPPWAGDLIENMTRMSSQDRKTIIDLAERLSGSGG